MKVWYVATILLFIGNLSCTAWCKSMETPFDCNVVIVETGIRSGKVVDATTGRGIEGAVVSCQWDVREAGIESSTRQGALYETTTDQDGRYHIPSQAVEIIQCLSVAPEPEDVYIYKPGYLWCRVRDWKADTFMITSSQFTTRYRKTNHRAVLQPWVEGMSHIDHMEPFTDFSFSMNRPVLEEAFQNELLLARREKQQNKSLAQNNDDIIKQILKDRTDFQNGTLTKEDYIDYLYSCLDVSDAKVLTQGRFGFESI